MINQTNNTTSATSTLSKANNPYVNPDGILGKDDFMKLMLIELQYQDPTDPMDTEKILSQTSQLATLESADNTNKALEELSKSMQNAQQYSVISAIGKTASLGENTIQHTKDSTSTFDLYFPTDVESGSVSILDNNGNLVKSIDLSENAKGVYSFEWDGKDNNGNVVDDGIYQVVSDYYDQNGDAQHTAAGVYPIESVRFDNGKALVKLGSNYVPLENVVEIY
ncbi:Flagellar basal-body rod modification protein FlgD [hydrothermal vent metagenome]|uniref:Flagellar basal-body rod modification protein FlgD n=1 Tax=hydrothermal vent metagenome TaxID=652676 RepID=A0A1W1BW43_9ZZZZ